ncbi:MAG: ester cyclase [Halobacteriaceae archaeon]
MSTPESTESNKRLIREMTETVVNDHNFQAVDDYFSEDIVVKGAGSTMEGIEEWRGFLHQVDSAFPDFAFSIKEMLAEGSQVAFRVIVTGTHEGEFEGIPGTGNEFSYPAVMIATIEDGKITKMIYESDRVGLLKQLGVMDS